jgi:hypothetical protein
MGDAELDKAWLALAQDQTAFNIAKMRPQMELNQIKLDEAKRLDAAYGQDAMLPGLSLGGGQGQGIPAYGIGQGFQGPGQGAAVGPGDPNADEQRFNSEVNFAANIGGAPTPQQAEMATRVAIGMDKDAQKFGLQSLGDGRFTKRDGSTLTWNDSDYGYNIAYTVGMHPDANLEEMHMARAIAGRFRQTPQLQQLREDINQRIEAAQNAQATKAEREHDAKMLEKEYTLKESLEKQKAGMKPKDPIGYDQNGQPVYQGQPIPEGGLYEKPLQRDEGMDNKRLTNIEQYAKSLSGKPSMLDGEVQTDVDGSPILVPDPQKESALMDMTAILLQRSGYASTPEYDRGLMQELSDNYDKAVARGLDSQQAKEAVLEYRMTSAAQTDTGTSPLSLAPPQDARQALMGGQGGGALYDHYDPNITSGPQGGGLPEVPKPQAGQTQQQPQLRPPRMTPEQLSGKSPIGQRALNENVVKPVAEFIRQYAPGAVAARSVGELFREFQTWARNRYKDVPNQQEFEQAIQIAMNQSGTPGMGGR